MRYTIVLLAALLSGCFEIRDDAELKTIEVDVDCEKQKANVRIIRDETGQATKVKSPK